MNDLHWGAAGAGSPIVLLHGFSFDSFLWKPQVAPLSKHHQVITYDLRGFGASPTPTGPYRHSDDLQSLLTSLAIERPILVGLSLGANVALAYTLQHPDEVAGLVLVSPGLPGHVWKTQRPPEAVAAHAAQHGVAAAKEFWLNHPIFLSTHRYPEARASVVEMVTNYSGWHWQNTDSQQPGPDVRALLPELAVPTLVISGDHDVEGYREIAATIAATAKDAKLERFADAGHVMNLEQPEAFTAKILEFAGR